MAEWGYTIFCQELFDTQGSVRWHIAMITPWNLKRKTFDLAGHTNSDVSFSHVEGVIKKYGHVKSMPRWFQMVKNFFLECQII